MAAKLTEPCLHRTSSPLAASPVVRPGCLSLQIWSMKKDSEASTKKKPKVNAAQLRVQKGQSLPHLPPQSELARPNVESAVPI